LKKIERTSGVTQKRSGKKGFNPRPYSEEVLANHSLNYDEYRRFWIYDGDAGIWKGKAELRLKSILRKKILGTEHYKRYCVGEVVEHLKGLTFVDEQLEEPPAHLIPFENKIYDLESGKFLHYSPDYFFINKLAVRIDQNTTECPTIDKIFREMVRPQDVATLYEIAAYALYRGYPYQVLFILYGNGGNGKTAYVNILNRFLGTENMSFVGVADLQNNRFASSQLHGKLVNVSGEMDYTILKNTSRLKQCCGEDLIYCERKYKEPYPFRNYAKMIFLTNQVPQTGDKTDAFYRRVSLLEFPNEFIVGDNADPMVVHKIPEQEFEGLAWQCVQKLRGLSERDFVFTNHQKVEDVAEQYETLSDPLGQFLDEKTESNVDGYISVGEFAKEFNAYLRRSRLRVWTKKTIGTAMREKGFGQKPIATVTQDKNTRQQRCWLGLEQKWAKCRTK